LHAKALVMQKTKVAVIGSGSWATALVKILLNNIEKVNWWIREPEIINHLSKFKHNPQYLSSVKFDVKRLELFNNISSTIKSSQIIVFCLPAAFFHETVKNINPDLFKNKIIISAIKGIIPDHNLIVGDYFKKYFGLKNDQFAIVTGPSHAEEVAFEKLTYLTVVSYEKSVATEVATLFNCRYIKTSFSDDLLGTEYAPVLKNIIAIASGICNGLGYGDNFQAVLISNAIKEIKTFLDEVSPMNRNVNDSAYLGDLLVTCYSQFSRNRMFGNMIGKGYSVKFAKYEMKMIAEGYYAVKGVHEINSKRNLKMSITEAVYNILYKEKSASAEIKKLTEKLR